MPSPNAMKIYIENGYYHIYNQGVNKCAIFVSQRDRDTFLNYLNQALSKYGVRIIKYVIAGNHYHLIIQQREDEKAIAKMMHSIGFRYTLYFNYSYGRVGSLFRSRYKARLLDTEKKLQDAVKYLDHHKNEQAEVVKAGKLYTPEF